MAKLYAVYKLKEEALELLNPETLTMDLFKFFIENLKENGKPIKPIAYCNVETVEEITKQLGNYGFIKQPIWSDFHVYQNVKPEYDVIILYRIIIDNEILYLRKNLLIDSYSNIRVTDYNIDNIVIKNQINNKNFYLSTEDFIELKNQILAYYSLK